MRSAARLDVGYYPLPESEGNKTPGFHYLSRALLR